MAEKGIFLRHTRNNADLKKRSSLPFPEPGSAKRKPTSLALLVHFQLCFELGKPGKRLKRGEPVDVELP